MENEKFTLERVLIVGGELKSSKDKEKLDKSLDELEELVIAAGGQVVARVEQHMDAISPTYYIGRGKVEEIKNYAEELEVSTIVFNDELSGAQLRNLEEAINKKIVDRTNLILDIFASRASSKEGKLQVKLAQLKYRLPRLIGFRDYLSREGGGIGTRGPGEQKLETDRRHILREIDNIEDHLKEVEKNRDTKRKQREDSSIPIVALVGYTNVGKSTLMNKIVRLEDSSGDKDVFVKDMLFATLDTSLRRGRLLNGQDFILTDTVGFVSKLPTKLIEAFKGTLEEVQYADLILHVVDGSNEDLDIQIETTYNIMKDLGVLDKPILTVFNKMDKTSIEDLAINNAYVDEKIFISAFNDGDIQTLLEKIENMLPQQFKRVEMIIPYSDQKLVDYFMTNYNIEEIEYVEEGTLLKFTINHIDFNKYSKYIK